MNGDDKTGAPPKVITEGPAEPYRLSDKPVATAVAELERRIAKTKEDMANIELELHELKRMYLEGEG